MGGIGGPTILEELKLHKRRYKELSKMSIQPIETGQLILVETNLMILLRLILRKVLFFYRKKIIIITQKDIWEYIDLIRKQIEIEENS